MLYFAVILLYESNRCALPHVVRLIGNLMIFSKMYNERNKRAERNLHQVVSSGLRFQVSEGEPNICSISLSFCCTKATDVPYHTNVRKDLQFMTTSCRIKWFEISSFGGGPNICSISLSFCCTKATDVPYHTS